MNYQMLMSLFVYITIAGAAIFFASLLNQDKKQRRNIEKELKTRSFFKVVSTIKSCLNSNHIDTTYKMIRLYNNKYKDEYDQWLLANLCARKRYEIELLERDTFVKLIDKLKNETNKENIN